MGYTHHPQYSTFQTPPPDCPPHLASITSPACPLLFVNWQSTPELEHTLYANYGTQWLELSDSYRNQNGLSAKDPTSNQYPDLPPHQQQGIWDTSRTSTPLPLSHLISKQIKIYTQPIHPDMDILPTGNLDGTPTT